MTCPVLTFACASFDDGRYQPVRRGEVHDVLLVESPPVILGLPCGGLRFEHFFRLGLQVERAADDPTDPPPSGPRLGGTGARRADDERGVRIPRLDERVDG